ncbi:circadian clock protein KaiB [Planktothrix sp. FACHB-1355]|uniref:Circadian clock protein KaiB n=1 Tax=Aerosakkonema funiforme FACHB-1375 TaxID=2949571 RepID=A0A926VA93_9CYAN|nr:MULTISPECIES: circadian clock KaiB family protein [Oscillatoriales]MBD2180133.1 circadian clock protein KaiB [Aerosakkonema funiforme FACHB-1375]MBD3557777.1 circadian clock protein KaiB [Planktothrix sp. FACHB-1355]
MTADKGQLFKGIALFTPGGDLIYCIDPNKQNRWHLHLCAGLQEILGLTEPPHFLVPCYTATIDRWIDPRNKQVRISAEAYPAVLRYQSLLNAVFETGELLWQTAPWHEDLCDPMVLGTYRDRFPQLWEEHDLVVRFENSLLHPSFQPELYSPLPKSPEAQGYVLRLFVSGHNSTTERILQTLHKLLEQSLYQPYTLKVIDVFKHPEQAEADQISATPTLVKVWPRPIRRIVGEIEDIDRIMWLLVSKDTLR